MGKSIHVIPSSGRWVVRREGEGRATRTFNSQSDAVSFAINQAKGTSGRDEVVVHGRDGRIRSRDSYGDDPSPPRDRRH